MFHFHLLFILIMINRMNTDTPVSFSDIFKICSIIFGRYMGEQSE